VNLNVNLPLVALSHYAAERAAARAGTLIEYQQLGRTIAGLRNDLVHARDWREKDRLLSLIAELARQRRMLLPSNDELRRLEAAIVAEYSEQEISPPGAAACG